MLVMRKTNNYYALPFNPKLKDRARALRKAGNLAEVLLWNQIKGNQLLGLDFDRQKIIGHYIVDFYCAQQRVVIEVDGNSHDNKQEYDAQRDAYLMGLGLFVIHISDNDVKSNLNNIMKMLLNHVALTNSPPLEGWQAKPDGVVL
jgi:very-short-patch-repair endonuclease